MIRFLVVISFVLSLVLYNVDKPLTDKAIAKGEENVVNLVTSAASVGLVSKFVPNTDIIFSMNKLPTI